MYDLTDRPGGHSLAQLRQIGLMQCSVPVLLNRLADMGWERRRDEREQQIALLVSKGLHPRDAEQMVGPKRINGDELRAVSENL